MSTHALLWMKNYHRVTQLEQWKDITQMQLGDVKSPSLFVSAQLVAPQTLNICAEGGDMCVCVWGGCGLMAGHMGRASSPSVCQPTWLLLWQACPRQDHRLGPPVGLQQGSPASPSPLEHPSFHLRPGGPHPALQPSAPRCHRSPSCSALRWNNSIVFHCLPCCVCNRNSLGACFFIFIYFPAFACLVLGLQGFKSGSLRGSSFQWCESIFRAQIPGRPFYSYCTNVVWLSKVPLVSAVALNSPTWRIVEALNLDSLCLIEKTIAGSVPVVYFSLWFLHLWFNEIVSGAAQILRGKVRWGGGWSDILDILWFSVYLSLFDLNETTGCRTDPACESDPATLHTSCRNTRRANSCSTPVVDAICERELLKHTVMVQFIINHIWFARLP